MQEERGERTTVYGTQRFYIYDLIYSSQKCRCSSCVYLDFEDEEMEAQRGKVASLSSTSLQGLELELKRR